MVLSHGHYDFLPKRQSRIAFSAQTCLRPAERCCPSEWISVKIQPPSRTLVPGASAVPARTFWVEVLEHRPVRLSGLRAVVTPLHQTSGFIDFERFAVSGQEILVGIMASAPTSLLLRGAFLSRRGCTGLDIREERLSDASR